MSDVSSHFTCRIDPGGGATAACTRSRKPGAVFHGLLTKSALPNCGGKRGEAEHDPSGPPAYSGAWLPVHALCLPSIAPRSRAPARRRASSLGAATPGTEVFENGLAQPSKSAPVVA